MTMIFHFIDRPPPVRRLMEVNEQIERHEVELEELYMERDRLNWMLEDGDHSE